MSQNLYAPGADGKVRCVLCTRDICNTGMAKKTHARVHIRAGAASRREDTYPYTYVVIAPAAAAQEA